MNNKLYKERYIRRLNLMNSFYSLKGRSLKILIKKISLVGWKYLYLLLVRRGLLRGQLFTNTFLDQQIYINILDAGNQNFFLFGIPARKEAPLVMFLLSELKEEDIFYDVGANYGIFALVACTILNNSEVHLFEPNRKLRKFLQLSLDKFNNVKVIFNYVALGNKVGKIVFFDYTKSLDSSISSIYPVEKNERISEIESYEVDITTIDNYIISNKPPTVIKVDIESAEYDFLLGAKGYLSSNHPTVILEFKLRNPKDRDVSIKCLQFMKQIGYQPSTIFADGSLGNYDESKLEMENHIDSYENVVFKKC